MSQVDLTRAFADEGAESPILVFGGPYSNERATAAMRRTASERGIPASRVICTGDVVAYCAEPEETVEAIRDWGCHVIAGNCEEQLAAGAGDCGCGFEAGTACDLLAKGWYPFANQRVSAASRAWMAALPSSARLRWQGLDCLVVHGGVGVVNRFVFASEGDVLDAELDAAKADLVVAGHAGIPFIAKRRRGTWFNAGVIGMPANDGTPDGWYGLITPEGPAVRFETRRLAYDYGQEAADLRRCGHANDYARTLVTGRWPSLDILPAAERAASGKRLRARRVTWKRPVHGMAVAASRRSVRATEESEAELG